MFSPQLTLLEHVTSDIKGPGKFFTCFSVSFDFDIPVLLSLLVLLTESLLTLLAVSSLFVLVTVCLVLAWLWSDVLLGLLAVLLLDFTRESFDVLSEFVCFGDD